MDGCVCSECVWYNTSWLAGWFDLIILLLLQLRVIVIDVIWKNLNNKKKEEKHKKHKFFSSSLPLLILRQPVSQLYFLMPFCFSFKMCLCVCEWVWLVALSDLFLLILHLQNCLCNWHGIAWHHGLEFKAGTIAAHWNRESKNIFHNKQTRERKGNETSKLE